MDEGEWKHETLKLYQMNIAARFYILLDVYNGSGDNANQAAMTSHFPTDVVFCACSQSSQPSNSITA